jgi:hypothetical protein
MIFKSMDLIKIFPVKKKIRGRWERGEDGAGGGGRNDPNNVCTCE